MSAPWGAVFFIHCAIAGMYRWCNVRGRATRAQSVLLFISDGRGLCFTPGISTRISRSVRV
jgi:hypothetical protein